MQVQSLQNYNNSRKFTVLSSTRQLSKEQIIQMYKDLPSSYQDLLKRFRRSYGNSPQTKNSLERYLQSSLKVASLISSDLNFDDTDPFGYLINTGFLIPSSSDPLLRAKYKLHSELLAFIEGRV